jgi:hypothetical protein
MTQKIVISTTIDITPTGVRNKSDDPDWLLKRNQQRNYDTLIQVISLRVQPLIDTCMVEPLSWPGYSSGPEGVALDTWHLCFTIDQSDALGRWGEVFLQDVDGVPIVPGLTQTIPSFPPQFMTKGPFKNIDIFVSVV